MPLSRRSFLTSAMATMAATPALGQTSDKGLYSHLKKPGLMDVPPIALRQRVYHSYAPEAADQGRWVTRADLLLPRSEMAWATAHEGRLHIVGGYGAQRVDRPYHHVYDQASDTWIDAPPLPKGANHVGVAIHDGQLYAIGGHTEQNRRPHAECFAYDLAASAWRKIRPLPRPCGATGCVTHDGRIHVVGGATGTTRTTKHSIDWHLAYEPMADTWHWRAPLPTARDHIGIAEIDGAIHVVGGRVNNFHTNSNLHHRYNAGADTWERRAMLPTARSGHGAVVYRGKLFVMGGEGSNRVFGQNEAYDPKSDTWEQHAPMTTPRHGLGAALIGDFIHVVGGGPQMGGRVQSAVHEAFTLG